MLYDADPSSSRDLDGFGPYGIEQSVIADALSKSEVAQQRPRLLYGPKKGPTKVPRQLLGRGGRGVCLLALRHDGRVAGSLFVTLGRWGRAHGPDAAASRDFMAPD